MSALVTIAGRDKTNLSILEIGTYMEGSLFTWASAIKNLTNCNADIYCIDPWHDTDNINDYPDNIKF